MSRRHKHRKRNKHKFVLPPKEKKVKTWPLVLKSLVPDKGCTLFVQVPESATESELHGRVTMSRLDPDSVQRAYAELYPKRWVDLDARTRKMQLNSIKERIEEAKTGNLSRILVDETLASTGVRARLTKATLVALGFPVTDNLKTAVAAILSATDMPPGTVITLPEELEDRSGLPVPAVTSRATEAVKAIFANNGMKIVMENKDCVHFAGDTGELLVADIRELTTNTNKPSFSFSAVFSS